jgi:hypothetical protein
MKTIAKKVLFLLAVAVLFQGLSAFAQEDKTKVHLKVKKQDEVTLDTTLFIQSGSENDELKKLIQKYTDMDDIHLHILHEGDLHKEHAYKVMKKGTDSLHTVIVTTGDKHEDMDIEILEKDGKHVMIKKKVSSDDSEKAYVYAYDKGNYVALTSKDIKVKIDTLEAVDEKGEKQVRVTIKSGGEGGEHVWVSKGKEDGHRIIMKHGEGDDKVFAIVSGDSVGEFIHDIKADFIEVISEEEVKKMGKDKKGNFYVVKKMSDLDEGEEIVIKQKDGSVVIMKGDEVHDLKGENVYIKTYDDKEGAIDIFLEKGKDGTVVVKKNIKVVKKVDEEGEEYIEVVVEEGDKVKKKEVKEEKKKVKKEEK